MALRVFISYAHESEQHRSAVAGLAGRLRHDGIDARIDQYVEHDPPYWPTWMVEQIDAADIVLCVASPNYQIRVDQRLPDGTGLGSRWEGLFLIERAYQDTASADRKFLPVGFSAEDIASGIPRILLSAGRTRYLLPRDYEVLYRRLTQQPRLEPPAVGNVRQLGARPRAASAYSPPYGRPPLPVGQFRDRIHQTRSLVEYCHMGGGRIALVTGRPGIGKSTLVTRVFEVLEHEYSDPKCTAIYISAERVGNPLNPEILETAVMDAVSHRESQGKIVVALDHIENLLDDDCRWHDVQMMQSIARLTSDHDLTMILVGRSQPADVPTARDIWPMALLDGIPDQDAREWLLESDRNGSLGLAGNASEVEGLIQLAKGNPRCLELLIHALVQDPLLKPSELNLRLTASANPVSTLIAEAFQDTSSSQRCLLAAIAVAGRPIRLEQLAQVPGLGVETAGLLRSLVRRHLVKYDRIGRLASIDRDDATFVLEHLIDETVACETESALVDIMSASISGTQIEGIEADSWSVMILECLARRARYSELSATILGPIGSRMILRGLYSPILDAIGSVPAGALSDSLLVAGLHAASLKGDSGTTRRFLDAAITRINTSPESNQQLRPVVAKIILDFGTASEIGTFIDDGPDVEVDNQTLLTRACLRRRLGKLESSETSLRTLLSRIEASSAPSTSDLQTKALAIHQIAMTRRLLGDHDGARPLWAEALQQSVEIGDLGGIAYRYALEASLRFDAAELTAARSRLEQALTIYQEIDDSWGGAAAHLALAVTLAESGELLECAGALNAARALSRQAGNRRVEGLSAALQVVVRRRTTGELSTADVRAATEAAKMLDQFRMPMYAARVRRTLEIEHLLKAGGLPRDPSGFASFYYPYRTATVRAPRDLTPGLRFDWNLRERNLGKA